MVDSKVEDELVSEVKTVMAAEVMTDSRDEEKDDDDEDDVAIEISAMVPKKNAVNVVRKRMG